MFVAFQARVSTVPQPAKQRTQDPVCSQGLGTMLGHTSAPSGARPRSSHPHPPFLYIFKTPNGVRFPRPSFTSTSAVPRCPALSRRCPALSRAPFLTAHLLSRAVPRFPALHFYQHSCCPALSRAPFLPAQRLSRAFPRTILTSTSAVPRCPALHFYLHSCCPALSRAPFLPPQLLSRAFRRTIFTSTAAVPRCPADTFTFTRACFDAIVPTATHSHPRVFACTRSVLHLC